jgi:hypothetical protein
MKLNKRQKLLVCLAGLAVIALLVDKFVLRGEGDLGPSAAEADQGSPLSAPAPTPGGPEEPLIAPKSTIDERLAAYDAVNPRRDPFVLSEAMRATLAAAAEQQKEAQQVHPQPETTPADEFAAAHRLEAVLISESGQLAIVDGRPIRVGESLDGFRLAGVETLAAVFERGGQRVRLSISPSP